jgi:pyrimidine deaminase RibD-like protein
MKIFEVVQSDYKIHDRAHLDQYLVELCSKIVEGQQVDPEMYGMVAACVLDPDHNQAASTSTKEDGKWKHAERNAIEAYEKNYGEIPEGSIIITTLSPCDGPMSDRYQGSCTDLINASPVKKVYCGYMDPSQHDEDFEFTVEDTANKDIQRLCKKFADTFLGDEDHPMEDASGVIATKKQAKDPRYSMSLTRDVRPGQIEKNLKAFDLAENFADGKNPGRKGLAKRSGVNTKASVSSLRKTAKHSTGEKARMAHWLANMKAGKAKKK